jgi:hypothetical protein
VVVDGLEFFSFRDGLVHGFVGGLLIPNFELFREFLFAFGDAGFEGFDLYFILFELHALLDSLEPGDELTVGFAHRFK